jgi:hypothetical protein
VQITQNPPDPKKRRRSFDDHRRETIKRTGATSPSEWMIAGGVLTAKDAVFRPHRCVV